MQVIDRNVVGNETCVEALKILGNCLEAEKTHEYLCSEELNLLPKAVSIWQTTSHLDSKVNSVGIFLFIARFSGHASTIEKLVDLGIPSLTLDQLRIAGDDTSKWQKSEQVCVSLIQALSRFPSITALFMSLNTLGVMAGIAGRTSNDDEQRNKGIYTITFLVGKEEATSPLARYMNVVSDSVERLLEAFRKMVVDKVGVTGFNIRIIMTAF